MRVRRTGLFTISAAALLLSGIPVSVSPLFAQTTPGGKDLDPIGPMATCTVGVQNPHFSSGANGVIAKPYWSCPSGDSEFVSSWVGFLYKCSSKPDRSKAEKTWQSTNGCVAVRSGNSSGSGGSFTVKPGTTVVRHIPAQGTSGASSGAWFIACVRGSYSGNVPFAASSNAVHV